MNIMSIMTIGIGLTLLSSSALAGIGDCKTMKITVNNNTSETWTVSIPPVENTSTIKQGDTIEPGVPYQREVRGDTASANTDQTTQFVDATGKKSFFVIWIRGACWFGKATNTSKSESVVNTEVDVKPLSVPRWDYTRTDVTIQK